MRQVDAIRWHLLSSVRPANERWPGGNASSYFKIAHFALRAIVALLPPAVSVLSEFV
ncbi:hypothetical protein PSAB6_190147 [Paraburkholderia sabiae]|nr:hypothetical protein PSAB6_190147 [Paraburkholderia sabiae]